MTVQKVKVSQREVVQDIRSGMDETAIRKKYNLSTKGLKRLYEKLAELEPWGMTLSRFFGSSTWVAILADVREGMTRSELMAKYRLSEEMLREVSRKLLDAEGVRSAQDEPDTLIAELSILFQLVNLET